MKRKLYLTLALMLLTVSLTACGPKPGSGADTPAASGAAETAEQKSLHAVVNRIDSYLVLLLDDGSYQIMNFGEGVTADGLEEGDSVDVTYTGELGSEDSTPVIVSLTKAE